MMWNHEFDIVATADGDMLYTLVQSIQPDVLIAESRPTVHLQRTFEYLKARIPDLRIVMLCASEIKDARFSERLRHFVDAMYTEPIDLAKFGKCVQSMEWTQ
jgi:DNA-binding NarL/FixJ family response regulator